MMTRVCSNDDPRLTFDFFMAKSNLHPLGGWVRQRCHISCVTGV